MAGNGRRREVRGRSVQLPGCVKEAASDAWLVRSQVLDVGSRVSVKASFDDQYRE
jgi:hypothetical protein